MAEDRKYWFNLPWPGTILGAIIYGALSIFVFSLADGFIGLIRWFLLTVSAGFAALGFVMLTRRVVFPRFLILHDDEIIFPHGFPRSRATRIRSDQMIRIIESPDGHLSLGTSAGDFEVTYSHLRSAKDYLAIRDFISGKLGVTMQRADSPVSPGWLPQPLMEWVEPEDWPGYRTRRVRQIPLALRVGRACRFFICCIAIFVVPWLLLLMLQIPTAPAAEHLWLSAAVSVFLTILYWLWQIWGVGASEISIRPNGITQNYGKQVIDRSFQEISEWKIIELPFDQRALFVILLRAKKGWVNAIALPDQKTGDALAQMLEQQGVPEAAELKPPWE